ncbi:hypothetical protein HGM15179_013732 [Zosterops borbonicus]|uniref:Uncharacterized protein n=1 Tax=Zosterops borbonicus TaxID=364589 RepID=A0A8K1G7H7_9PASS|nr:hypothetical protein HGM15179_013732 [Zosterops borbonicus]
MLEQFRKNCNLWEEHTWKKFMECSHGRDFTLEQGKSVRSTFPEEEGFAETTGSWSEDNIYTNVWSILNHKIEKTTCQQVPSVKLIFTGP